MVALSRSWGVVGNVGDVSVRPHSFSLYMTVKAYRNTNWTTKNPNIVDIHRTSKGNGSMSGFGLLGLLTRKTSSAVGGAQGTRCWCHTGEEK
jgi:hypothetical protein